MHKNSCNNELHVNSLIRFPNRLGVDSGQSAGMDAQEIGKL